MSAANSTRPAFVCDRLSAAPVALADSGWLCGALLVAVGSAIVCYHYPAFAQAFFEYAGRALVEGKTLYRDVWDNKLPSIYYVNAFWQLIFGSQYVLHWVAELCVELATIGAFAVFAYRERIASWAAATFGFAVLASLPSVRAFDHTEAYALLFIMLALVAVQRAAPISGGVLLAIAATFWLPAGLMLLAMSAYRPAHRSPLRIVLAFSGAMAGYFALIFWAFGAPAIGALLRDMAGYETLRSDPHGSLVATLRNHAAYTIDRTLLVVPLVALAAVVRLPGDRREGFALFWLACALAGAAVNLNFFDHYFLPSTAPLAFAIAAFTERRPFPVARRAFAAVLGLLLIAHAPATLRHMRFSLEEASAKMRDSEIAGRILAASLPANATIAVYAFEPGIYLHAHRDAPGRFANALGLDATTSLDHSARAHEYRADVRSAGAFVMFADQQLSPELRALLEERFISICRRSVSKYRIFLNRRQDARAQCDVRDAAPS